MANHTALELVGAIEELGGALEPAQREKFEQARRIAAESRARLFARLRGPQPVRRRERPGRNEPCWCGSGVKYKKCHLSTDPR